MMEVNFTTGCITFLHDLSNSGHIFLTHLALAPGIDVHYQELRVFNMTEADTFLMFCRSASEQKALLGHSGPVYGLSFNTDNSFLVSSSEDGTGEFTHFCMPAFQEACNFGLRSRHEGVLS